MSGTQDEQANSTQATEEQRQGDEEGELRDDELEDASGGSFSWGETNPAPQPDATRKTDY